MSTALVIDDNRQMGDSLAQIITLFGFEVKVAYGSRLALEILKSNSPSVIFLDINMPGVSGFEILSYVKRAPKLLDIPVIIVSSDDQPETFERSKQAGATDYIVKPATFESIEAVLKKLNLGI